MLIFCRSLRKLYRERGYLFACECFKCTEYELFERGTAQNPADAFEKVHKG